MSFFKRLTQAADPATWGYFDALLAKHLIDGTMSNGALMRRKIDGHWQYRKMTEDELLEWQSVRAW